MAFFRSIPPIVFIILGALVVVGVPILFAAVLQPRYQVLDGRPALDVLLKLLPWTLPLVIWWGFSRGERNVRELLQTRGVVAPASVTWVRDDQSLEKGAPVVELFVRVTPEAGEPFDATVKAVVSATAGEPFRPGMMVRVRYDPQHPKSFIELEE